MDSAHNRVLTEHDGLTKAEAEEMAFLVKAGAVPGISVGKRHLPNEQDGLTKAESEEIAFLGRAGFFQPRSGSNASERFHR